jgi:hypothetical protein
MSAEDLCVIALVASGFGFPLAVIGVILRLCEGSWGKARGELGATGFLGIGVLLCLPIVILLVVGSLT